MNTRYLALVIVLLAPSAAAGQAIPDDTVPDTGHTMVRAAGMPLRDGELPPGALTVRVVRGDFSNNVIDAPVQLETVDGAHTAVRTGSDGRAQFPHVGVGAQATVSAVVDGESLRSEMFEMPAESGIRVLLIAGGDPAAGLVVGPAAADGDVAAASPQMVNDERGSDGSGTGIVVVKTVLVCSTLFAFVLFWLQRRNRIVRSRQYPQASLPSSAALDASIDVSPS